MTDKLPGKKDLKLKVAESIQDDVNKGIVRVDSNFMKEIGVRPGDIVEIAGDRATVAIVDRAYPGDIGLNIIRMDGIIRRNAKTGIGEYVRLKKAEVKEAKKVVIAPASKGVIVKASPVTFKQGFLGRAIIKGDIVSMGGARRRRTTMSGSPFFDDIFSMLEEEMGAGGFGFGDLKFIVVDTTPKDAVIISEATEVVLNPEAVEVTEEKVPEVTYEDVGGLEDEIKKIREMVELPLKHPEIFERLGIEPPKGVLLHGPPGTGKTLIAKAVANESNSHFILINGPEIMSKYYGQSEENIRKKFEEAEKNAPSIIFIDEVDAIAPRREEVKGEVERRVVAQLLAMMDGLKTRGRVVVIAATNVPNILDPALRRPGRFDREIEVGVPRKEGRLNILKIHTRNMPMLKDVDLAAMAEVTYGFVGADLSALAKEAAMIVLRRVLPEIKLKEEEPIPKEILDKLFISQKDFKEALKVVRPSAMREVLVEVPNVKWTDVGGLMDVKQQLKEAVEWPLKNPSVFTRMGIKPPRGILMYGPSGTGKTMLAKAVASESQANFILVKGPELLSKWVGESEKAVREVFKKARQTSPTIIFFDEIDSLAPKRGAFTGSHVTESVVNQLLTEMDGLEEMNDVVILAASNRPDIIDSSLLRPGRFDRIIHIPVPDEESRYSIFKVHTAEMPIVLSKEEHKEVEKEIAKEGKKFKSFAVSKMASDEAVSEEEVSSKKAKQMIPKNMGDKEKFMLYLARKTEGYTGADIEAVCREAAIHALRKDIKSTSITLKDFTEVLGQIGPSVTKEIEKMYEELEGRLRKATSEQMKEERPSYMG